MRPYEVRIPGPEADLLPLTIQGLFIVDIVILVFGVLSAVPLTPGDVKIPGYPWLLLCRFGVGFGAGGTSQAYVGHVVPDSIENFCSSACS